MMAHNTRYFSLWELIRSATAAKYKIDNTPTWDIKCKLYALIENTLDPIREKWGKPIFVNSGYRCRELNAKVGGVANSAHLTGEAADITVGNKEKNWELYQMIKKSNIPFTKMIFEHNSSNVYWVHISYSKNNIIRKCMIYDPATRIYREDK